MNYIASIYNYRVVGDYLSVFLHGILATVWISAICLVLSLVFGVFLAGMRMSSVGMLWRPAAGYIQFVRATPLLVQIYLVYYGLPMIFGSVGFLTETVSGIIALTVHTTPYMGEIIRSGIQSVDKGQREGAMACGMTRAQTMWHIVLPQAFANVVPTLLGQTAVLIKDTSLLSIIAVFELMSSGLQLMSERVMPNEAFLTTAVCYLLIYGFMLVVSNRVQRRLGGGVYKPS
ncbi:MAG: amino acid ABC transporter permease [Ectothiorhodospiraceae bacterium]|jgi:polar amino acid transport system permease protein